MFPSPTGMFLTKGIGVHRHALTAFEFALRDADIEQQNLVYVSPILPPRCEVITREVGIELLKPGGITFCVLARSETNEFGRHVYASLGLARQADPDMYGYIQTKGMPFSCAAVTASSNSIIAGVPSLFSRMGAAPLGSSVLGRTSSFPRLDLASSCSDRA